MKVWTYLLINGLLGLAGLAFSVATICVTWHFIAKYW